MNRFQPLLPKDLLSLFDENFRYKIIVYPIMITYYLDKEKKSDDAKINKEIKSLSKSFYEFLPTVDENRQMQTNILDYFKSIGKNLIDIGIGISCMRLFKSKMPYYRNFERLSAVKES